MAFTSTNVHLEDEDYLKVDGRLMAGGEKAQLGLTVMTQQREYLGGQDVAFYDLSDEDLRAVIMAAEECRVKLALAAEGRARRANA